MKLIPVQEAVGMVLNHDITEIVPGRFKGPAFKRGQIIREEDVEKLRNLGKENICALELGTGRVHEDDAAARLAAAASGKGVLPSAPSEGKINLLAESSGLLKINVERLDSLNFIPDIMMATLHTDRLVERGQVVAGTRIIPLTIEENHLQEAEALCSPQYPVVEIKPVGEKSFGVINTGSEVYHKRIKDTFGPVVKKKIDALGSSVLRQIFVPDNVDMTAGTITGLIQKGAEIVLLTGGMSVDPDDLTPASIRATGAEIVTYGAPVLPGAMFMLAYLGDVPILGLPGCVMYHKASILDLVLPRILAGERLRREDIISYGHGGMCLGCENCRFPECGFGR